MDRQLFVLGEDIWNSIDCDDVIATSNALQEINMFKAPFEEFDLNITMSGQQYAKFMKVTDDPESYGADVFMPRTIRYKIRYDETGIFFQYKIKLNNGDFVSRGEIKKNFNDSVKSADHFADVYLSVLIVLLATKNAEKQTEQVKRHGPKSRKRPREYRYITTIKIGKITETMRSNGESRGPVRAHLRRGHIRNQRFGEGLKEIKQIFIQPVFVNADEGWIENQRKEYRVKM